MSESPLAADRAISTPLTWQWLQTRGPDQMVTLSLLSSSVPDTRLSSLTLNSTPKHFLLMLLLDLGGLHQSWKICMWITSFNSPRRLLRLSPIFMILNWFFSGFRIQKNPTNLRENHQEGFPTWKHEAGMWPPSSPVAYALWGPVVGHRWHRRHTWDTEGSNII